MSLEEMQEQVERYYIEMENELLMNIAIKLSQGKPMEIDKFDTEKGQPIVGSGGVNEWQLERLKELGGLNEENAKIIAKYSGKTQEEVERVFEKAREIGTEVDEEILSLGIKAGILNEINPIIEDITVKNILINSINEVLTTFNKQNNSLLASAGENYKEIVNKVSSAVMAGTKTTNKAMQEAVSELAQRGLTGFTARNGAEWTPEAYTKMIIRSNTQNTINRIQDERMRLSGNDYIEVSSHLGARPLCSEDQGQIFSLSGNTKPIKDGSGKTIYPRAWSSSSFGKPAGIFGINCGHSRYAFIPNLSYKREMDFTKEENDEAYKEKQQQRLYERTIRNKKREIAMLKETGAEQDYIRSKTRQLSNYKNEYLEFLERTDRTRITANEWIGSTKLSSKNNDKAIKAYQNWKNKQDKNIDYVETTNKWIKNAKPNSHVVKIMDKWEHNGKKYSVDGKNVLLDYSKNEKEVADWIENIFGGEIYLCPRVNNPIGVSTPDYFWKNEYWDLKEITGSGNRTIDTAIKKKKNQANNFIFDVSNSELTNDNVKEQLVKIYSNKDRYWVNKLLVKRDNDVVVIYERNKKRD